MAMAELPGPYDVRAYDCVSRGVVTNTCPMAPYRGVSRPVITFALERLMDKAAARVRHRSDRNPPSQSDRSVSLQVGDGPHVRRGELSPDPGDGGRGTSTCRHSARGRSEARAARPLSRHRLLDVLRAHRLRQPGVCRARHGDHAGLGKRRDRHGPLRPGRGADRRRRRTGRGLRTTLAQIIADEIGIEPGQIRVVHGDTDRTPYGWGTFASRSLVIAGGACLIAARKLRTQAAQASRAICLKRRPPISCSKRAWPRSAAPTARSRSRRWRARPIIRPIASTARSSRA